MVGMQDAVKVSKALAVPCSAAAHLLCNEACGHSNLALPEVGQDMLCACPVPHHEGCSLHSHTPMIRTCCRQILRMQTDQSSKHQWQCYWRDICRTSVTSTGFIHQGADSWQRAKEADPAFLSHHIDSALSYDPHQIDGLLYSCIDRYCSLHV